MKVTVIGTGYVGLVTGTCLADLGNDVLCVDIDPGKVAMLRAGRIPIHEPGLAELVSSNVAAGRLRFTDDTGLGVQHGQVQFIAVGTPPGEDGSADLSHVVEAARTIGREMSGYRIVVNKSTVPVGTADRVREAVEAELSRRGAQHEFDVVSNPEFLKEGAAVADFMRPDRIVVGASSARAIEAMRRLYAPFERNRSKLLITDTRSAELIKYAANAMLATRISFMNELALLAERVGADIDSVRRGIGSDPRIGSHFLYAGCGYGGSCFPKDVSALIRSGEEQGMDLLVVRAVHESNRRQRGVLGKRLLEALGPSLAGRRIAVWGLAFKPDTDDVREAPSRDLIDAALHAGASVVAYDPIAAAAMRSAVGELKGLTYAPGAVDAAEGADALAIVTEWKEFRSPDLQRLRQVMRTPLILDGRNILDPVEVREAGFRYIGIGRR